MKIDLRKQGAPAPQKPAARPSIIRPSAPTGENQQQTISRARDLVAPKVLDWIVIGAIYLLAFLMPIFFLPNVPSILELNKQLILVILGGIAFLSWIGKLAWEGRIRIKKNFLLIPVLVLLLIFSLSTVFSTYQDQSMWGSFGTESLSLVTIIALVAVFFVITNNFDTRTKVSGLILAFLASSFLASLFAIFQMFGKFLFDNPALAQNSFNTVGSVYAFSAFIGAALILAVAAALEKNPMWMRIALVVFSLVFVFALIAINFRTTLVAFLVGMAVLLGLSIVTSGNEEKNRSLIFPMVILTLILLTILIGRNTSIVKVQLPVEVGLSQSASFDVLKETWKDNFLLGEGFSNYDLAYLEGKPLEINLTNFWGVRFNEAASRFFTLATSTGFLGAAAIVFLFGSMLVYMFTSLIKLFGKRERGTFILIGLTAAWIYLTILHFFYASNITIDFSWWIVTAAFVVMANIVFGKKDELISETSSPRVSLILSFVFVVIIVGFISLIFLEGQKYAAAASYNKALAIDAEGGNLEDLAGRLGDVVNLDSSRDLYHRNLSVALFTLLNQRVAEKGLDNLTENDRAEISNLYFAAETQANEAINLNPKNPDNYVQLAQINQNVIGSKEGADEAAIETYKNALSYSPKDPSIHYQIGQVYLVMADLETARVASQQAQNNQRQVELPAKAKEYLVLARQNFEDAVKLKDNYIPAHFMIAVVLDRLGEIDQAIAKLEESKKMNPQDVGILFQLGVFYYRSEQYDPALAEFEQAVRLAENYSNARYFLGLTLDKLDRKNEAIDQFKKVEELNPENEDVKKIIANLEAGKDALAGIEETLTNQGAGTQTGPTEPSIQREQEPVPPETPIEPPEEETPPSEEEEQPTEETPAGPPAGTTEPEATPQEEEPAE